MKQCKKCKELKDESEFNKYKDSKDGLEGSCKVCRKYNRPQHICSNCGKLKQCKKCKEFKNENEFNKCKTNKDGLSGSCKICIKNSIPLHTCSKCNELKTITTWVENKGYCCSCYIKLNLYPEYICSKCNKLKKIINWIKDKGYCDNCYIKKKYKEDPKFNIEKRLRCDVSRCFKYRGIKKIHKSKEYGIDFDKIREHVGPPPNKASHLDHIFPLAAFDYNDEFQIKASFHYTNFQWLSAEENQKKSAKYNKEEFEKYLDGLRGKI